MSGAVSVRCVICTLFYSDKIIFADRTQASSHIYRDHDYHDKLKVARILNLITDDEKRSAWWLANHLAELSIIRSN
jgi:hypothetical protein